MYYMRSEMERHLLMKYLRHEKFRFAFDISQGNFFFRYKTISYHTTTQQVCIILIFLLIFALFNLPQSFHCHLRRALRVDSAGLNTKIRQLDTIYICFAMRSVWHGVVRLCMPIDIYSKCENSLSPILI